MSHPQFPDLSFSAVDPGAWIVWNAIQTTRGGSTYALCDALFHLLDGIQSGRVKNPRSACGAVLAAGVSR